MDIGNKIKMVKALDATGKHVYEGTVKDKPKRRKNNKQAKQSRKRNRK